MKKEVFFRNAETQDWEKIIEIYNSTISSRLVTADTEEATVESKRKWFELHNAENRPLWIVENQENLTIGWVSFQSFYGRPAYNGTVEISIYLHSDFRKQGYGKTILDQSMQRCKSMNIKTLLGFIFAHNLPSIRLFENCGFVEWGHLPNIAELDGIERSLKILGKRI